MKGVVVKDGIIYVGTPSVYWIRGVTKSGMPIVIYFPTPPFKREN